MDKSFAGEAEDVPVLSTSVAYGVYMAVSSNLRYEVLKEINIYNYSSRNLLLSTVSLYLKPYSNYLKSNILDHPLSF